MSNETATKVSNFFSAAYSPTREYSTAKIKRKASFPTQPRTSQLPTKASEMKYSMVTAISSGYIGVLLPICLLAIFLSCVVCVYHWQGIRERRLDLEEDRKRCQRKRTMSEFDSGCTLRTIKPVNKKLGKARSYPWKTTKTQDLHDINNNEGFIIPISPGMKQGTSHYARRSYQSSAAMAQATGCYERPVLKRTPIHDRAGPTTKGDLSSEEPSIPSVPDVSLNLSAADTTIESCLVISSPILKEYPALKNDVVDDVKQKNSVHVTRQGDDGQVVTVETIHGQLLEYWV
ncbi:unnamed protein product [Porites evermanni]|uniref:Uncharacterized protein n=1 Tax=Porites evermanni TaxID=104178 RepID=A0ABN8MS69_9CNID|nr:unnamed protein product [Porites evermanni]